MGRENDFERRMCLYSELTPQGKKYVDDLALQLEAAVKARGYVRRSENQKMNFGEIGGRELALALLEHCWDGELPNWRIG